MRAWLLWALIAAPLCAGASVDFAVSANLLSLYNRWGVDRQGNILIAANPTDCTLPTVKPLYMCGPIWVGKLDATGKNLVFATYLGGGSAASASTNVAGISADANGNIIVAAHTTATDMPIANAYQATPKSKFTNLYIAKLPPDGSRLMYATYLGGSGGQTALSLAVDSAGSAYVAVSNNSTDFPTTPQSYQATSGLYQTAVVKLDPNGALQYAALFPFEFYIDVKPIQVDTAGRAVLVSKLEALTVMPDGSALIRAPYPAWVNAASSCTSDANNMPWCAQPPWALPRSGGGFQFAGAGAIGVPVTENARQIFGETNGHLLIQNGQATQTQLTQPISGFAVDPKNRNRIYAATPSGLFVSQDNGGTWTQVRGGPCLAIVVDPFDSTRLYLSLDAVPNVDTHPRIYRSTDSGATWTSVYDGGLTGARILSLAADPKTQGLLYGAGPLLYRSTDGGNTWDSRSVGPSRQDMSPSASTSTKSQMVLVDPAHAGWAYVVGITNCLGFCPNIPDLSRTQDSGNTWQDLGNSVAVSSTSVWAAVDPADGDVIETAGGKTVIYRTGNFASPQTLGIGQVTSIAFDPSAPGTIYAAAQVTQGSGSGYFIMQSVDDGATWTKALELDRPAFSLAVSANGAVQASQTPNPPQAYFLISDPVGNISYGTYFGGAFTQVNSMASSVPGFGSSAFVGGTTDGGLPLLDAVQPALGGGTDGFLFVFDDTGTLLWSTYLGGSGNDSIDWVLPLPDGSAVVVGTVNSTDFPGLQPSPLGAGNTYIAHLRP